MSLFKKLLEVAKAIPEIQKTGYNGFHDYKYATEEDIVKPVREALFKNGILLMSNVDELTQTGEITTVKMTFTFYDTESGESASFVWYGQGQDKGDKGVYKAQTGALKYFLLKNFLIPSATDPENAKLEDNTSYVAEPATDNQKNLVKRLVAQHASETGRTVQEVEQAFGIDYNSLTKGKASQVIDRLKRPKAGG